MPFSYRTPLISPISIDHNYTAIACLDREEDPLNTKARIDLVRQNHTSLLCVRKRLGLDNRDLWRNEIEILRGLSNPHICAYVDAYIVEHPSPMACLFMEYCDLGDLHDLIDKYVMRGLVKRVPEAFAWQVFLQMIQALCYIHQGLEGWEAINRAAANGDTAGVNGWTQVIHRDIKPGNIFLQAPRSHYHSSNAYPICKLGDFGLAIDEHHPRFRPAREHTGTPGWLPPEYPNFGQRGDIWVLGAVVQTLCSPERSPEGADDALITDFEWDERENFPAGRCYSEEINEAVGFAMEEVKSKRPYARDFAVRVSRLWQRAGCVYEPLPRWALEQTR